MALAKCTWICLFMCILLMQSTRLGLKGRSINTENDGVRCWSLNLVVEGRILKCEVKSLAFSSDWRCTLYIQYWLGTQDTNKPTCGFSSSSVYLVHLNCFTDACSYIDSLSAQSQWEISLCHTETMVSRYYWRSIEASCWRTCPVLKQCFYLQL